MSDELHVGLAIANNLTGLSTLTLTITQTSSMVQQGINQSTLKHDNNE